MTKLEVGWKVNSALAVILYDIIIDITYPEWQSNILTKLEVGRKVNSALAVNATKPIFASALLPTRPLSMITKLSQTKEDNQGQTNTAIDNHRHQRQPKATRIPRTTKDTRHQRQPRTARQPYWTKENNDNQGQPGT